MIMKHYCRQHDHFKTDQLVMVCFWLYNIAKWRLAVVKHIGNADSETCVVARYLEECREADVFVNYNSQYILNLDEYEHMNKLDAKLYHYKTWHGSNPSCVLDVVAAEFGTIIFKDNTYIEVN